MRTVALIKRICLEMVRDKRTLALLFVAPLLILSLMYLLFNGESADPTLGVVNIDQNLVETLVDSNINVKEYEKATNETVVKDGIDGLLQMKDKRLELTLQNSDPSSAKALQMKINQAVASQIQIKLMGKTFAPIDMTKNNLDINYIYGNSET